MSASQLERAPHIVVEHVGKSFGEAVVLDDVDATFLHGEISVVTKLTPSTEKSMARQTPPCSCIKSSSGT